MLRLAFVDAASELTAEAFCQHKQLSSTRQQNSMADCSSVPASVLKFFAVHDAGSQSIEMPQQVPVSVLVMF